MSRPNLTPALSSEEFRRYYWLKEELVGFCRQQGIPTRGGKIDIANRIAVFLATGKISDEPQLRKPAAQPAASTFDWHSAALSAETVITDRYKNTQNVRRFFLEAIGPQFAFNVPFMAWIKVNTGKTLEDAVVEWHRLNALKKDPTHQTEIAPQFEYNRYMRDFLADNPGKTSRDALKFWKRKRALPGDNIYARSDLELTD